MHSKRRGLHRRLGPRRRRQRAINLRSPISGARRQQAPRAAGRRSMPSTDGAGGPRSPPPPITTLPPAGGADATAGSGGASVAFADGTANFAWLDEFEDVGGERSAAPSHHRVAGRLREGFVVWRAHTSNAFALNVIERGLELPLIDGAWPEAHHCARNHIAPEDLQ